MGWIFYSLSDALSIQKEAFDCEDEEINLYLKNYAEVSEQEGFSKVFLMISDTSQEKITGFYTLSSSSIPAQELPSEFMKGFVFPCPAILIGQFALDKLWKGQKLSRQLLWDAYRRIILLHDTLGFRAIRVDTRTEEAKSFWINQGFIPFTKRKSSLFLPIETLLREFKS